MTHNDTATAPIPDDAVLAKRYDATPYQSLPSARGEQMLFGLDGGALANLEQMRDVGLSEWYDAMDLAPQQREQTTAAFRQVGAEIGLNRGEVGEIVATLHAAWREPIDAATADRWTAENERRLSQMHGSSWREALADVDRVLAKHPDLHEIMREARITSNPRIVDLFISKARALKGRL